MNKFIGSGRLTRSPEMRYTQAGKSVCSFTIAIDEGFGENKRTTFLPITVWGKQGEACGKNLVKGQLVLVEGRISVRSYEAKDGTKKYATDCVASYVEFGTKPKGSSQDQQAETNDDGFEFHGQAVPDEEIPF